MTTEKKKLTVDDILYMYKTVLDWNTYCGNNVNDKSLIPMYNDLSKAEFYGKNEFLQGYESGDLVMQLDGVGDLAYTTFYWELLSYGMPKEDGFEFKIKRNLDCTVQDLGYALNNACETFAADCVVHLMQNYAEVADVVGVFNAITTSNYSKVPLVSEVVYDGHTLEDEVVRITNEKRYGDVSYKLIDTPEGQRVVFLAMKDLQDGVTFSKLKIIKSRSFKEVEDLSKFIY